MPASLTFITELARKAGGHLLNYFNPLGTSAQLKGDRSLVTEADLAADRWIAAAIQERFPGSMVLSEELNPALAEKASEVWVVDPLDGTTNFSLGLPIWGVSIALLVDGWPHAAAVHFPVLGETFTAAIDQGTCLNGERIFARPNDLGRPNTFFSCCSRTHRRYEVNVRYKTRILGSTCYSVCAVARGMALISFEATPKIWDIAACWLIVRESGGVVETYDNSQPFPLQPGRDYQQTDYPTLAAASPDLLAYARRGIRRKPGPLAPE
jgi:myo-inositol-1(or 4)-monophosphatase